jgi:sulfur-carrier protein adenylyltransferase/sulfurtransferase
MSALSDFELRRYNRQIILPEIGVDGQIKLKESRALVIGAGGLGSPVLMYLVAAGVGSIGIADYDRVDISNIHRQILYTAEDTGKLKTLAAFDRLHGMNSDCLINTYNVKITRQNIIDVISGYDVVIDCSDNFPTRYLVSDATEMLDIPLVFGAVYQFYGQVSVFNYMNGPAYRCLFPEMPSPGEVPSCTESGIIGFIPGIVGSFQACEAIKIITGAGEVLSGKLLQLDALSFRTEIIKFSCAADYRPMGIRSNYGFESDCPLAVISPSELAKEISDGSALTIYDIRSPEQFRKFNIGGLNVRADYILNNPKELPTDGKVVIVCEFGDESLALVDYLQNTEKLSNIFNLEGGIRDWIDSKV